MVTQTHGPVAVQLSSSHVVWCEPEEQVLLFAHQRKLDDATAIHENVWGASRVTLERQKDRPTFPLEATVPQRRKRHRPRKEMRMRCRTVAQSIEKMGTSAFAAAAGCDMAYLSALLGCKAITRTGKTSLECQVMWLAIFACLVLQWCYDNLRRQNDATIEPSSW